MAHTLMAEQDPLKTSMTALALALESEVAPAAAHTLSQALEIFWRSRKFSPPQRAAAKMRVARLGWAFVTEARKEKGARRACDSPTLRDAMKAVQGYIAFATSGAPKAETAETPCLKILIINRWLFFWSIGYDRQNSIEPRRGGGAAAPRHDMGARRFFFLQAHYKFLLGPCVPL
jgi:hypothetical protein